MPSRPSHMMQIIYFSFGRKLKEKNVFLFQIVATNTVEKVSCLVMFL